MNSLRQVRALSQSENEQILAANGRLLAKREERARLKAEGKLEGGVHSPIPIRTAGDIVAELLGVANLNPCAMLMRGFDRLIQADVEAADGVIGEPLANAIERGIYTIGASGERIPITEENWESTCNVITVDGHSFCLSRLFWDGKLFGEGGRGA